MEHGRGGTPGLVTIVGEAGIGKTALAEFLAAEAAENGGTVLQTRCYETERSLFLQPIVEAIAPVVARASAIMLRQLLGEHATAAAGLLQRSRPSSARRRPGGAAWRWSGGAPSRRCVPSCAAWPITTRSWSWWTTCNTPVSRRWSSSTSSAVSAGARLLVVATVRAENDAEVGAALAPVARRVEVGPLGPHAVGQLARAAGQAELADRILERTRGHTLFVVEVLRALTSGEPGVPESLRTAVQARVRRAGPPVEALLRAAAVLGQRSIR